MASFDFFFHGSLYQPVSNSLTLPAFLHYIPTSWSSEPTQIMNNIEYQFLTAIFYLKEGKSILEYYFNKSNFLLSLGMSIRNNLYLFQIKGVTIIKINYNINMLGLTLQKMSMCKLWPHNPPAEQADSPGHWPGFSRTWWGQELTWGGPALNSAAKDCRLWRLNFSQKMNTMQWFLP